MPVSVVRETAAGAVNAALRESLASSGSCSAAAKAKHTSTQDDKMNGGPANNADDIDTFHAKLVASAKRVSFSKLDYKEVANYGQSVLETLKSKYIILNPPENIMENDLNSVEPNNNGANDDSEVDDTGNNTSISNCVDQPIKKVNNTIELPAPKRILYPRENVRIGWKATGRKWEIGVGMMNVGNSCYLNSTLQALFHVPSMANWLMSDSTHMESCETSGVGCIICAMTKTLQESQKSQSAIEPHHVYSKLNPMCKNLVMGRQEDAHEFLRYLMEAMEKCYLSRFQNYKELDQYSKETTPLNQILGGYLKSAVRCLACSHVSVTFQHFQDLLLDIRKADTVDEALEGYFSRERLEDMGYRCDACKKNVSATKQFSLERAPIALCIQLKRFSMSGTKLNKQIQIKPRLDLTKFASRKIPGEQLTYRLVAMVTHLGTSPNSGHYTAIGLTESGLFYNYDDSYVRPISMQNVCNTNAYIIFYEMDTQPSKIVSNTLINSAETNSLSSATNKKELQTLKINGQTVGNSHRIIGPQLPPGYKNNTNSNGGASSPLSNGGNTLILNRNSSLIPSGSSNSTTSSNGACSKIMIHFKNNSNTLPSMPKLGAEATTSTSMLTSGFTKKSPAPVKSLVPYGSETDEEADVGIATTALNAIAGNEQKKRLIPNILKRRWSTPSSFSSSSSDNDDGNDNAMTPSNNKKIKKAASSTTSVNSGTILKPPIKPPDSAGKKSLNIIDDIFNNNKRTNIANVNNKTSGSNTHHKKKPQNQQFIVTSTATDSSSGSEDDINKTNSPDTSPPSKKSQPTPSFPPVVKTNSGVWQVTSLQPNTACTSPTTSFPSSSPSVSTAPKNPKNPFATKPLLATANAKRTKKDTSNKLFNGNGYLSNAIPNETTVSELLKESHRGYGAPILDWNGQQSDIDKENFYLFDDEKRIEDDSNNSINNNDINIGNENDLSLDLNSNDDVKKQMSRLKHHIAQILKYNENKEKSESNFTTNDTFSEEKNKLDSKLYVATQNQNQRLNIEEPSNTDKIISTTTISPPSYENSLNENYLQRLMDEEMENIDSCSSGSTEITVINTYSLSPVVATPTIPTSSSILMSSSYLISSTSTLPTTDIIREVDEQRQRDWEDEEENEIDRGRQKKIKAPKDPYAITPDYNPFQEQENQKRWRRYHYVGDGGVCHRNNFQRNKFKSQRFTQIFPKKKYERWWHFKCE